MTWDGFTVCYAAARWLSYLAAFLVVGSVAFQRLILPRAAARSVALPLEQQATRIAFGAAVLLSLVHFLRIYLQARSLLDADQPVTAQFIGDILSTSWGKGWMAQVGGAVVAAVGARGRSNPARSVLAAGALGIAFAAPLTGHAVGLPQAGRLGYPLDLLHFTLGATWLGTLATMLLVGLRGDLAGVIPPSRLVAAFSPVALVSGLGAIGLGGLIAWRYLGALAPFVTSVYGRTVLLKVAALGGIAGLGAYHWRVVRPRLDRGADAPVKQSSTLEVAIGVILIGITAVLVALPLPGED